MGELTQEIREKLESLMIPPQASPTTVGVSLHQVKANHLVAGLTNTLGSLRSRPMPTPAAIPTSPFRTENGPAALQPRDEFYKSRAGLARADSLEGNGGRGALWL